MAIFSAIASAIGGLASSVGSGLATAAGVAGTIATGIGQYTAARGARKAEDIRQRQMDLQASRERRAVVRQATIARATAMSNATAQGASEGSGLAGGLGSISSQAGSNIQGINQGQDLGNQMFAANRQISRGQTMASIGGAIQGFGQNIAQNFQTYNRLGQYFGTPA